MRDASNLSDTIIPKSDQLNAEQLLSGPITITVTAVSRGNTDDQPVTINYEGDSGLPYKPCKTMRKVLIFAWGDDGREWVGRSMTLYNNPEVKFGGVKVGGIRISHLSHIERDIAVSLTSTKGKKEPLSVAKLVTKPAASAPATSGAAPDVAKYQKQLNDAAKHGMDKLGAAWKSIPAATKKAIGPNGCPADLKTIATAADNKASAKVVQESAPDSDPLASLNAAAAAVADEPATPEPEPLPTTEATDEDDF